MADGLRMKPGCGHLELILISEGKVCVCGGVPSGVVVKKSL